MGVMCSREPGRWSVDPSLFHIHHGGRIGSARLPKDELVAMPFGRGRKGEYPSSLGLSIIPASLSVITIVPRFKRIGVWVALALWAALPASALDPGRRLTQYLQRIWQTRQGLPQSSILAIHQTRDGYLWLGTDDGVVRFDGVRFTSPEDLDGLALPKMSVRQLAEDARGGLWIATSNAGLFRIEHGSIARFSQRDGLPSDHVACLFPGRDGDLWACTDGGLARIRDGKIRVAGAGREPIVAAAQRKDGTVWAGGDGPGLIIWNGTQFTNYTLHSLPPYARVQAMFSDSDDVLWIGTTAGLIRLQRGREQRFTKADGLANDSVLSLAEGGNGSIWIGTDGGFSRWRNGEVESFLPKNGLSQSTVASLYQDREGSLWVGTKRGLNQFLDRRTLPFTTAEGLPSDDTGPVFQDPRGVIWVGTLGAGLARFDGRRSSVLTKQDGLSSNSILALAGDAKGTLWVGTDAGLDQVRDGRTAAILPGTIRSLYQDAAGTLWIGTSKGPAVLRDGSIVRLDRSDAVVSFVEVGATVLAAVEGFGIKAYDERTLREVPGPTLAIRDADTFYRDPQGRVWIGGIGSGLHLLDGGKQVDFSMQDGLFDDEIYGIVADRQDRLWLASSKGIFSVNLPELLQFAAGKATNVASTPFSPLDGLQTVECKTRRAAGSVAHAGWTAFVLYYPGADCHRSRSNAVEDGCAARGNRERGHRWPEPKPRNTARACSGRRKSGVPLHRAEPAGSAAHHVPLQAGRLRSRMGGRGHAPAGVLYQPASRRLPLSRHSLQRRRDLQ